VSISSDGSIFAVGARFNDENAPSSGNVRVFENIGGNSVQIENDIYGEEAGDYARDAVSISSNGTILAIGSPGNDGSDGGHVRIYRNVNDNWMQLGKDIDGEASGDYFEESMSLLSDETILGVGTPANDSNGNDSSQVQVY